MGFRRHRRRDSPRPALQRRFRWRMPTLIDPPTFVLCCVGGLVFYLLYRYGVLTADTILKILSEEI